ncbi:MAG: class I SAM-dependent methyltransferase [Alphaproteobacteria bacterium]|nr:class I SAM-dependent methyltransferase [Alphaproteobacteria bacterium]
MVKATAVAEDRSVQQSKFVTCCLRFFESEGLGLESDPKLLEFGCGHGELLAQFDAAGLHQCFGFEVAGLKQSPEAFNAQKKFENIKLLRLPMIGNIPLEQYALPFESEEFNLVVSNVVFEHVMNYETVARELSRTTAPGGVQVHLFPGPLRPLEGHTNLPFGGALHSLWYLRLYVLVSPYYRRHWAPAHAGLSNRQRAERMRFYLTKSCNYPSRRKIKKIFSPYFTSVSFEEANFFSHWPGGLAKVAKVMRIPPAEYLHNVLRLRVLVLRK